jgi:hypothetical protein
MPQRKQDLFELGGVDSRSNPANYPPNRLLRCKNWTPLPSGQLRLRYGYTVPPISPLTNAAIHSSAYYEKFDGTQFILYGEGSALFSYRVATGVATQIGTLSNTNPWGHFRAGNRIFLGNGVDMVNFDGTTLRITGIRALTTAEAAGFIVTPGVVPAGTWTTSLLSGYQLYAVIYNPTTGHVGNRMLIGARFKITATGMSVVLTGLPNWGAFDPEFVIGFGRTNDGGEVPYWLIDASGNRIVAAYGSSTATLTLDTIDTTQELPTRNGVPPALNRFSKVGSQIFGARDGDNFLHYSEDETDLTNGNFVGSPYESWAGNNIEAYPTGERPLCVQAYQSEGWFFSGNYLAIWSTALKQQGVNPWRGPWMSGCAGQRAFCDTPHGPVWMTPNKQLMFYDQSSPVQASDEYEASLLHKIGDQYVATTELGYLRDAEKKIDRLYVLSRDKDGNELFIVHDGKLKDFAIYGQGSAGGQAYEFQYAGMIPNTFVGAGYTPRQNAKDINGRERLWTGATDGHFYQLEDGNDDNGHIYSADAVGIVNAGNKNTLISGFEWEGDQLIAVSFSVLSKLALADFSQTTNETIGDQDNPDNRFEVNIGQEARWVAVRMQLDSHPTDGNFDVTDPPFIPMPTYGLVNYITAKLGTDRPEGR